MMEQTKQDKKSKRLNDIETFRNIVKFYDDQYEEGYRIPIIHERLSLLYNKKFSKQLIRYYRERIAEEGVV